MNRRILFCVDGHAVHAQSWMRLLEGTDWDVHASVGGAVPTCPMNVTFHTLDAKAENPAGNRVLPFWPLRRGVTRVCRLRFGSGPQIESRRLAALIRRLRPAIVHSLRLQNEGYTVLGALRAIRNIGARWVVSLWGSDLCFFAQDIAHRQRIESVLESCDAVTADCRRDLNLSLDYGATPEQLFYRHPLPGNGGLEIESLQASISEPDPARRDVILFPKAREDRFRRFAPIVEALRKTESTLSRYSFVFLHADETTRRVLATLPTNLQRRCRIFPTVPRAEALGWLRQSRVMIAPSLSDGTPNVMLEAMATGAFPILSPLESIHEWIEDGENGLLADNEDADALARAMARAGRDDDMIRNAARRNLMLVSARADRRRARTQVLHLYDRMFADAVSANRQTDDRRARLVPA